MKFEFTEQTKTHMLRLDHKNALYTGNGPLIGAKGNDAGHNSEKTAHKCDEV